MKYFIFLAILGFLAGCSTQQTQEKKQVQQISETKQDENKIDENEDNQNSKKETTMSGSPVNNAVQTMEKSAEEMAETIKMVQQLQQTGDYKMNCRTPESRITTFKSIQTFFNRKKFQFDDNTFWFLVENGNSVGLKEEAPLEECIVGMFDTFKRLIAIQMRGEEKIQTEFYIDEKTGNLMVHRYIGLNRVDNENYQFAGY